MLNRGILGRQTKCIPAHRLHYIATLVALVTIDDIAQGVVANMAHMQATAGVREHRQAVEFFPRHPGRHRQNTHCLANRFARCSPPLGGRKSDSWIGVLCRL